MFQIGDPFVFVGNRDTDLLLSDKVYTGLTGIEKTHIQKLLKKIDRSKSGSQYVGFVGAVRLGTVEAVTVAACQIDIPSVLPDAEVEVLEVERTHPLSLESTGVAQKNALSSGAAAGLLHYGEVGTDGLFEGFADQFRRLFEFPGGAGVFGAVRVDDLIP